ncbi:MAG: cardiolipin synthase [Mariniblastus sp.]|nr:cardiolipin synthase [Mariniblastus sp.]
MTALLATYWPLFLAAADLLGAALASLHALLKKRETHSVIGWVGLIWLAPFIGWILYFCFGINRIQRRGCEVSQKLQKVLQQIRIPVPDTVLQKIDEVKTEHVQFKQIVETVEKLTHRPLLPKNDIQPLLNGDQAYPVMLQAIADAKTSISLVSYIFDNDRAGQQFIEALDQAHRRGVEVRVLIDGVGAKYSRPSSARILQKRGVPCRTFLPTLVPRFTAYANLRNHRKILVVDGTVGFTGGMNIRESCLLEQPSKHPVQDLHFRFSGPVVTHLQEAFLTDWAFTTGEILQGEAWLPIPPFDGQVLARGITDGPDEDFERLLMTILAAISIARERIVMVTPYFLPDPTMIRALILAVLRGVNVDIIVPRKNNIRLVQWASSHPLKQVLEGGCNVYYTDPPFDHSKLLLVDNAWALVGSTNMDPRSLRLNFEFNVECYSPDLVEQLLEIVQAKIERATRLETRDLTDRHLMLRLRDGIARLMTPYL